MRYLKIEIDSKRHYMELVLRLYKCNQKCLLIIIMMSMLLDKDLSMETLKSTNMVIMIKILEELNHCHV
jgi:hypothetical protein